MKAIVITARGWHAGYLGCYGNVWINTPGLDRLAAQGVVFDQHYADAPTPQAAARAWRSGRYQFPSSPPGPDLLALLRSAGIPTFLVIDKVLPTDADWRGGWHKVRDAATGLDPCLDALGDCLDEAESLSQWLLWLDVGTLLPPWQIPNEHLQPYFEETPDEEDEAEAEDDEDDEEPDLADEDEEPALEPLEPWLDPPTGPIDPQDDDAFLRLAHTYAGAVSYFDSAIELLLAELKVRDLLGECLLIVTTDHGQALGEHGIVGPHRPWLHEELVHLPLLVRLPGTQTFDSLRIPALTQSIDLMPTLLDAFGLPIPPEVQGHSLLPLAREERELVRDAALAGSATELLLRTPEWALIDPVKQTEGDAPRGVQLYAKPADRWEVNDVQQHHLERVEALQDYLRAAVAARG